MQTRQQAASSINKTFRRFSSLTAQQKDNASKIVCEVLAKKNNSFVPPSLWGVYIASDNYDQVMTTQLEAKKYLIGRCFKHENNWIPLAVKNIHNSQ